MTNKLMAGLTALALLLGGASAMAQSSAAAGGDKAVNQNLKLNEDIKLLRKNVRSEKSKIILQALGLDADQTAKFLPIYKQYDAELAKLNDLRVANIQEYAKNYGSMTDNKADELVNQAISYYKKRIDLLANYYDKVRAQFGSGIAARFVQVESQLLNIIDLQIQANLPLIYTAPKS
jgi:hypothetical protein